MVEAKEIVAVEEDIVVEKEIEIVNTEALPESQFWNEKVALSYKEYLVSGKYPDSLPKEKKEKF